MAFWWNDQREQDNGVLYPLSLFTSISFLYLYLISLIILFLFTTFFRNGERVFIGVEKGSFYRKSGKEVVRSSLNSFKKTRNEILSRERERKREVRERLYFYFFLFLLLQFDKISLRLIQVNWLQLFTLYRLQFIK